MLEYDSIDENGRASKTTTYLKIDSELYMSQRRLRCRGNANRHSLPEGHEFSLCNY